MPGIQAVKADNDVLTRIIKYIPAEMITVYTSVVAILTNVAVTDCDHVLKNDLIFFKVIVIGLPVITPVWKFYSVKDNPMPTGGSEIKAAIFHAIISMISFGLYVYVAGDIFLKCWIENAFNPKAGAALLLLFSIVLVPLPETIILKTPIPPSAASVQNKI